MKEGAAPPPSEGNDQADLKAQLADCRLHLRLYQLILQRYRERIESDETKSIADLKLLVQPLHPLIQEEKHKLTNQFHPYIYTEHWQLAAELALRRCQEFTVVRLPLSVWLSFGDIVQLGAGDETDLTIFFCSLLRALEFSHTWVALNQEKEPAVIYGRQSDGSQGHFFAVSLSKGLLAQGGKDEVFKSLNQKSKLLYAFNDREYVDFSEGQES